MDGGLDLDARPCLVGMLDLLSVDGQYRMLMYLTLTGAVSQGEDGFYTSCKSRPDTQESYRGSLRQAPHVEVSLCRSSDAL
jgi:hypothetical protein